MNSSRPYLVRALYEWIVDNDCTPHLLVNAEHAGVRVPPGYANDGQIVLNVSPSAVRHLHMDNEAVSFEGRFGGVAHSLYIPSAAVMAIYARENGQGMVFDLEPPTDDGGGPSDSPPAETGGSSRSAGRPSLKVVK
ncbi:Stringent starvation protein B [compost metagenome]